MEALKCERDSSSSILPYISPQRTESLILRAAQQYPVPHRLQDHAQ